MVNKIKMWNTLVVHVEWNKPPNIPIPLFKNKKYKLSYVIKHPTSKIVVVALEYRIDLSRLNVIALDTSNNINEMISM